MRRRNRPNETASRILNKLRLECGGVVSMQQLEDAVYGHRVDGGPDYSKDTIRTTIKWLRCFGFPIETVRGRGYRFTPTMWEIPTDAVTS